MIWMSGTQQRPPTISTCYASQNIASFPYGHEVLILSCNSFSTNGQNPPSHVNIFVHILWPMHLLSYTNHQKKKLTVFFCLDWKQQFFFIQFPILINKPPFYTKYCLTTKKTTYYNTIKQVRTLWESRKKIPKQLYSKGLFTSIVIGTIRFIQVIFA